MPEYTNNHLATVAYLTNWCAADGKLRVRRVRNGSSAVAAPRSVAYEKAWWSISRALNAAAEKACSRLESLAPPLLRPRGNWPYEGPDRATLAEFMALHILRTRAWRRWYETARETSLDQRTEGWDAGDDLLEQFVHNARSDNETLKSFERILGSVTGLLASMQWTLMAFDEPILVTSDQPVAPMPLPTPSGVAEFAAMPRGGLLDTLEIRFALGPANGLVLSWAQGPDRAIRGRWSHATNFNHPIISQAEHEYFTHPDYLAALPVQSMPWCRSLATELLPDYTEQTARDSPHRQRVWQALQELIDRDPDDRGVIPVVRPRAAVQPLTA